MNQIRHICYRNVIVVIVVLLVSVGSLCGQGSWTKTFIAAPTSAFAVAPGVAIDSAGDIHLSYVVYRRLFVRPAQYPMYGFGYDHQGSWGDSTYVYWSRYDCYGAWISRALDSVEVSSETAIAAGERGDVEISYIRGVGIYEQRTDMCTYHVRRNGGVWASSARISPSYCNTPTYDYFGERYPAISLDTGGQLHYIYIADNATENLYYRERSISGIWSSRISAA